MSKRERPPQLPDDIVEPKAKELKALNEVISLDFFDMAIYVDIVYTQLLLQLSWTEIQALRVVSKAHSDAIERNANEKFWRSLFMADIVDRHEDPMWGSYKEIQRRAEAEHLRLMTERNCGFLPDPRPDWEIMYERALIEVAMWRPSEHTPNLVVIPHLNFFILFKNISEKRQIPEEEIDPDSQNQNYVMPLKPNDVSLSKLLKTTRCSRLIDLVDQNSRESFVLFKADVRSAECPYRIVKRVEETKIPPLDPGSYWTQDKPPFPYLCLNEKSNNEIVDTLIRPWVKLTDLGKRFFIETVTPHDHRFDARWSDPIPVVIDTTSESWRSLGVKYGKDPHSPYFIINPMDDPEIFESSFAFRTSKMSLFTLVGMAEPDYQNSIFFETLAPISSFLVNHERRSERYHSYEPKKPEQKEEEKENSTSDTMEAKFHAILQISGKEESEHVVLAVQENKPEMGRLVYKDGTLFCRHELPVEFYKKWAEQSRENQERVCPLCPIKRTV